MQTNLIVHEVMTRQPGPLQCILAFFDPLLRCASLVVELYHIAGFPPKVRHNEADAGKKLSRMPLDLGDYSASDVPTGRLIPKAMIQDNRLLRRYVLWLYLLKHASSQDQHINVRHH